MIGRQDLRRFNALSDLFNILFRVALVLPFFCVSEYAITCVPVHFQNLSSPVSSSLQVHATMGGRVRAIFCGSAPLEPNVLRFVRCATGAVVLEGYGQTECAAVCACQLPGEVISGQVGAPLPSNMVWIS